MGKTTSLALPSLLEAPVFPDFDTGTGLKEVTICFARYYKLSVPVRAAAQWSAAATLAAFATLWLLMLQPKGGHLILHAPQTRHIDFSFRTPPTDIDIQAVQTCGACQTTQRHSRQYWQG